MPVPLAVLSFTVAATVVSPVRLTVSVTLPAASLTEAVAAAIAKVGAVTTVMVNVEV